jgi:RES domain-containing protein
MRVWRISQFKGLTGVGGTFVDGRWHTKPKAIIYAAEHPALAMVEILTHMKLSANNLPLTLRLLAIDVKEGAAISSTPDLPNGWQANRINTQSLGNRWLREGSGLILKCPSAVLPESFNYLINPSHPQASTHLSETDMGPFWFDARLIQT